MFALQIRKKFVQYIRSRLPRNLFKTTLPKLLKHDNTTSHSRFRDIILDIMGVWLIGYLYPSIHVTNQPANHPWKRKIDQPSPTPQQPSAPNSYMLVHSIYAEMNYKYILICICSTLPFLLQPAPRSLCSRREASLEAPLSSQETYLYLLCTDPIHLLREYELKEEYKLPPGCTSDPSHDECKKRVRSLRPDSFPSLVESRKRLHLFLLLQKFNYSN